MPLQCVGLVASVAYWVGHLSDQLCVESAIERIANTTELERGKVIKAYVHNTKPFIIPKLSCR